MTRTIDVTGASLDEALVAAISRLLGCREDEVRFELHAPGADGLRGSWQLALAVGPDETPDEAPEEAPDEVPGAAGEADRADDEDRVASTTAEPDLDDDGGDVDDDERAAAGDDGLDEEADAAADFLEGLLDALDLPGDLRIHIREDHAEVEVVDIGSGALIGRRGQTLEAIQELVRCSLQRRFQRRARVKIDAEGYRSRRLEKLLEKAEEAIESVRETGEPVRLEPMDVFERKAVHHLVAEVSGLASRSQGREPGRRVVIERE